MSRVGSSLNNNEVGMLIKTLIVACVLFSSVVVAGKNDKKQKEVHSKNKERDYGKKKIVKPKHHPIPESVFDVIPQNSPVKESIAKFLIKLPKGFDVDEASYQIKNAGKIFYKPKGYQKVELISGAEGKELRINVSKLPPGFYQLLVKIKDRSKKEHHFKTKYKDHAMFVIDSSLEVPMPDEKKNNATLLGIDSDNDGIRDDVQRWINENLKEQPEELKLAYRQYAIAMQTALPTSNDKEASIQASHATLRAQVCLYKVGDEIGIESKDQIETRKKIKMLLLNTKERIKAELMADKNFHGQTVSVLPKEETCNF